MSALPLWERRAAHFQQLLEGLDRKLNNGEPLGSIDLFEIADRAKETVRRLRTAHRLLALHEQGQLLLSPPTKPHTSLHENHQS